LVLKLTFLRASGSDFTGGFKGVKTNGFSQVGHGTVCPVPSAGYSMDCPQCGHSHLRKLLIGSLLEIQTPIAPVVHPKMILAAAVQFAPSALFSNRLGAEARARSRQRAKISVGVMRRRNRKVIPP